MADSAMPFLFLGTIPGIFPRDGFFTNPLEMHKVFFYPPLFPG